MKILFTAPVYVSNDVHLEFLNETLQSFREANHTNHEYDIALVENYITNTPPDTKDKILQQAPLLKNPEGNNVSAAWNVGIEWGFSHGADYVIVGNLDIVFNKQAIDNLVAFAEDCKNKKDERGKSIIWTASEWQNKKSINDLELTGVDKGDEPYHLSIKVNGQEHDWEGYDQHPHFSCFMVNKEGMNKLYEAEKKTYEPIPGYFDPGYAHAYFEDQDYHQRILRAGYTAMRCNSALFYHYGSRTIKSDELLEKQNSVTYENNRRRFIEKWGYDSHGKVPTDTERVAWGYPTAFDKGLVA